MKKKIFLFFLLKSFYVTTSIEYEIFEYSIQDIRMRKTLSSTNQKTKAPVAIDQQEYVQALHENILLEQKNIPEKIQSTEKPRQQEDEITEKKQEAFAPSMNKKELIKNSHYVQKEFDILAFEPVITKKHENPIHSKSTCSTVTFTIENNITKEMITYNHWSGSYTPEFSIVINETEITNTIDLDVPLDQPLKIQYKAIFPYGYSSSDFINYTPNISVRKITLAFDWHKTPRIIINEIHK